MARMGFCKHDTQYGNFCYQCDHEKQESIKKQNYIPPGIEKELALLQSQIDELKEKLEKNGIL